MDPDTKSRIMKRSAELAIETSGRGLTLRNVASRSGVTTQAVYTLFGGKEGLITALFEDCWNRLTTRLRAVDEAKNPLTTLYRLGKCYVEFGRENPEFYELIIGRATGGVTVPDRELKHAEPWGTITRTAVEKALERDLLAGSAEDIGRLLWSVAHGYLDLSINGFVPTDDDGFLKLGTRAAFAAFAGPNYASGVFADEEWAAS